MHLKAWAVFTASSSGRWEVSYIPIRLYIYVRKRHFFFKILWFLNLIVHNVTCGWNMVLERCNNEPIYMQNTYNTISYIVYNILYTIVLYYERLSNNKAIICTVKMEIEMIIIDQIYRYYYCCYYISLNTFRYYLYYFVLLSVYLYVVKCILRNE